MVYGENVILPEKRRRGAGGGKREGEIDGERVGIGGINTIRAKQGGIAGITG